MALSGLWRAARSQAEGGELSATAKRMRNDLKLPKHAAGVHLAASGPDLSACASALALVPGFLLELPPPKPGTQHTSERLASDRYTANLSADAKRLPGKL